MKVVVFLGLVAASALGGCSEKPSKESELVEALANASAPKVTTVEPSAPPQQGPAFVLAVLAGQGLGPIRIGAGVPQIERLMQTPCEMRSENLCRYASRGIDFHLVGGYTQWIHVQRRGRPAGKNADGKDIQFGFFFGAIPPDLRLGMLPEAIREHLGKPYRVEKVQGPNPQSTVWLHYYPGLVLEYDFWPETKKLILGGIQIVKDPNALPPGAANADTSSANARTAPDAGSTDREPSAGDAGVPPAREPEPR